MNKILPLPLLALLPLALTACGTPSDHAAVPPQAAQTPAASAHAPTGASDLQHLLGAHHWRLAEASDGSGASIHALLVRADAPVQLDFADGRLSVSNTCNRMSGGYMLDGDRLTTGRMASTMMACADPALGALDVAVADSLQGRFAVTVAEGDRPRLTLTGTEGQRLAFTGHPTAATRFGSAPERIFLEVAAGTLPCNHPLMPGSQCLQVREVGYDDNGLRSGEPGAWAPFHEQIEGYAHTPGVRNILRVDRYTRSDVPSDASRYAYVLDMVIESETVQH